LKTFKYFIPAVIWLVTSLILLTLPGSAFPKENWLNFIWADKLIHIGMFALLTLLWCYAFFKSNPSNNLLKIFLITGFVFIIYGAAMEFVQKYWIPNRSFELEDIIADTIGVILGFLFSYRIFIKK